MNRIVMPVLLTCGIGLFVFANPNPSSGSTDKPVAANGLMDLAARIVSFVDADRDGRISPAEADESRKAAMWILGRQIADCDTDADGFVTTSEYVKTWSAGPSEEAASEPAQAAVESQPDLSEDSVPLSVVLDQLAGQAYFREEVSLLRAELEDLDDTDTVVTYLGRFPTRYARLHPYVSKWVKQHPRKSGHPKANACKQAKARAEVLRNRTRHGRSGPAAHGTRNQPPRERRARPAGGRHRPARR